MKDFVKRVSKKMEELMLSDRTVLIVSHATDTLKKFCDRVLWINDGKYVMMGNTEDVLREYDKSMQL